MVTVIVNKFKKVNIIYKIYVNININIFYLYNPIQEMGICIKNKKDSYYCGYNHWSYLKKKLVRLATNYIKNNSKNSYEFTIEKKEDIYFSLLSYSFLESLNMEGIFIFINKQIDSFFTYKECILVKKSIMKILDSQSDSELDEILSIISNCKKSDCVFVQ